MAYTDPFQENITEKQLQAPKRIWLHFLIFVLTAGTTIFAGMMWIGRESVLGISALQYGLIYSALLLSFLTAHEFGHYFAAKYHKVDATLPFYIPNIFFPLMLIGLNFNPFGTFGAVIRTRQPVRNRKEIFDIGVAGPLAGFVVCVIILIIGLATLPGKEFLYEIHPEYRIPGAHPIGGEELFFGDTIFYWIMRNIFANPNGFLPPMNEIYHYPFLCVGWFGLFVTSLNMLPMGQLDGGHITYAMFGEYQPIISKAVWWFIVICGLGSVLNWFYVQLGAESPDRFITILQNIFFPPLQLIKKNIPWIFEGWEGWLVWAAITRAFIRLEHPPIPDETPLDSKRMAVGWISLVIFVLSFSYNGIYFKNSETKIPMEPPKKEEQIRERPLNVETNFPLKKNLPQA